MSLKIPKNLKKRLRKSQAQGGICGRQSPLWGEWPSGLRRCSKNRKDPGLNPTRRSVRLRDPTSLRGSR